MGWKTKMGLFIGIIMAISIACASSAGNSINNDNVFPSGQPDVTESPYKYVLDKIEDELGFNDSAIELKVNNFRIIENPVGEGLFIYEPTIYFLGNNSLGSERYYI